MSSSPRHRGEPIAICGLSLKFPQDASSERGFWNMLLEKRNAMTDFPPDRLNVDAFHHPTRARALRPRGAHFIKEDLGVFDANFFSLTPSEAAAMDPMQRILLETAFGAFENGGIRLQDVQGSRTSVHTGCFTNDYLQQMLKDSETLPPYAAVGATQSMLANRLSWFFDLRGPSVNLDSACSSSAMAVDLACQLLHDGTTDMGVVAGSNILIDPDFSTVLSHMSMLSPDSRCFAFDHRANGYSRGEGVAVVVLKRLSDALANNDSIRAVIRSTGTNQDGRTPGITQPDPRAQAQLVRETYEKAGLSMAHTRFFEAHGTGTAIGDPIEVGAIAECFHGHRTSSDPLYVGSVKTNIGHLEGASGIAGLIKAALAVESGIIPPNANFESLNRKLASYTRLLTFPSECVPWPSCDVRRASINSFGYGGTNSHVILDDVASYLRRRGADLIRAPSQDISPFPKLLLWSGFTAAATRTMVADWATYLSPPPGTTEADMAPRLSDAAYTLDSRRTSFSYNTFAVVSGETDLGKLVELASAPAEKPKQAPRLAFAFTGQGAQWYAMGRELLLYPEFAESIDMSEHILTSMGCSWLLREELLRNEHDSNINKPEFSQTLTTAVQIALVDLLRSFNIRPVAVVGHSMGEIAAAYCAEHLTRESALRVSYYRGYFTATIADRTEMKGAMLAVALPADDVSRHFAALDGQQTLGISCINSPRNTTVHGDESDVDRLKSVLDAQGIFARRLRVPVAYHSPQMNLIEADCLQHFGHLDTASPGVSADIKMVSSVTGSVLSRERASEGSYWTSNMVSPVLFSHAMERLCRDPASALRKKLDNSHKDAIVVDTIIEIGPHAALKLPIQETFDSLPRRDELHYLSALSRGQAATTTVLRLLGQLHCSGVTVDLRRVNDWDEQHRTSRRCLVNAPAYPFDHSQRYWAESPLVRNYRQRPHGEVELLGTPSRDWNPLEPQWRCCVRVGEMPWLLEHRLNGKAVYPAAAMMVMAMQGVARVVDLEDSNEKNKAAPPRTITGYTLRNVRLAAAIAVAEGTTDLETRLRLRPIRSHRPDHTLAWSFAVHSVTGGKQWVENCQGTIECQVGLSPSTRRRHRYRHYQRRYETAHERCMTAGNAVDSSAVYDHFLKSGFGYGPPFQGIDMLHHHDGEGKTTTAKLRQTDVEDGPFPIHPGALDSFLHLALLAPSKTAGAGSRLRGGVATQAISRIDKLCVSATRPTSAALSLRASATIEAQTARTCVYSGFALSGDHDDEDNQDTRLVVEGLETTVIAAAPAAHDDDADDQVVLVDRETGDNFWCGVMQSSVDVDSLSGPQVLQYLDAVCGVDKPGVGPGRFLNGINRYLRSSVAELRHRIVFDAPADGTSAAPDAILLDPTKPFLRRYVEWMDWQLEHSPESSSPSSDDEALNAEAPCSSSSSSSSSVRSKSPASSSSDSLSSVSSNSSTSLVKVSSDEAEQFLDGFFRLVADNAADVLRGSKDMLQLIFEDNLVDQFYDKMLLHSSYCDKLHAYLVDLTWKNPGLNFLEVGAGTGSFTEHIIQAVSSVPGYDRMNSYHFTDISPSFFERARERFISASPTASRGSKMHFSTLDAGRDPTEQGFEEGSMDVICASNVLHTISDLSGALRALRRLLKPGGRLLLHEFVRPERIAVGFVFGLLPGWWVDDESHGKHRTMSPLMSEEDWDETLRQSGFSGVDFALRDFVDDDSHLMSIMCATAVEPSPQSRGELSGVSVSVVLETDSGAQAAMAEALSSRLTASGCQVTMADLTSPTLGPSDATVCLLDLESKAILSRLDATKFDSLQTMLLSSPKTLWVSRGGDAAADPSHGMIDGFSRVFRVERSKMATLALEPDGLSPVADECSFVLSALSDLVTTGRDPEDYLLRNGTLRMSRIKQYDELKESVTENLSGQRRVEKPLGDVRPFQISLQGSEPESPLVRISRQEDEPLEADRPHLGPNDVEIDVRAVSLRPKALVAMTTVQIHECAGIVTGLGSIAARDLAVGDRVCAYGAGGMAHSTSVARRRYVAKVPQDVSFEEASAMPQDLIVASYLGQQALAFQRGLDDQDGAPVVVVRGANTRLGKATLDVLKSQSSSPLTLCASIGDLDEESGDEDVVVVDGVYFLPDDLFTESFRSHMATPARMILDFLGTSLPELTECVAPFGQILSVRGSGDSPAASASGGFSESLLPPTVGFRTVQVDDVLKHGLGRLELASQDACVASHKASIPVLDLAALTNAMASDVKRNVLETHMGEDRIAISYDDQSVVHAFESSKPTRDLLDPNASYLISGGLGDLGRCLATWMVRRGARNLILLSRSGPRDDAARSFVKDLRVKVCTPACDVSNRQSLQEALRVCHEDEGLPPVRGCVHAAGTLRDTMFERMTFDEWETVTAPKAAGAWNLHELLPAAMDFFIMTSSISGVLGQATKANYAAGNTFQDALARHRLQACGERAVSLDLGLLATGGMLSGSREGEGKGGGQLMERLTAQGVYSVLSEPEILALFEHFCDPALEIDSIPPQVVMGITHPSKLHGNISSHQGGFSNPLWSQVLAVAEAAGQDRDGQGAAGGDASGGADGGGNTKTKLDAARALAASATGTPDSSSLLAEMSELVAGALADQLSGLSLTPRDGINLEEPAHMAGADSLSAVHLRGWIMSQTGVDVAVFDILGDMPLIALGGLVAGDWLAMAAAKQG